MTGYDFSGMSADELDEANADLQARRLAAHEEFKAEASAIAAARDAIEAEDGYVVPTLLGDGTVVTESAGFITTSIGG